MPRPRNNNFARRGFTLIELLLAITLSGVLMATLFENLYVANKARHSAEEGLVQSRQYDLALQWLHMDLENVPPTYGSQPGTTTILANDFTDQLNSGGPGQTLDFYTTNDGLLPGAQLPGGTIPMPPAEGSPPPPSQEQPPQQSLQQQVMSQQQNQQWNAGSEVKQVEYALEVPGGSTQQCLVRRVWDNVQALQVQQDNPREEIVCRNVAQFSLRYFDGSQWQTTWDSPSNDNQMPAAVEVTLQLAAAPGTTDAPKAFVCVIPISCSNVANDPAVNTGLGGQ